MVFYHAGLGAVAPRANVVRTRPACCGRDIMIPSFPVSKTTLAAHMVEAPIQKAPHFVAVYFADRVMVIFAQYEAACKEPGPRRRLCGRRVICPSRDTPHIQQAHIVAGHIVCARVEPGMFPSAAA
jgi:hypothetical protein